MSVPEQHTQADALREVRARYEHGDVSFDDFNHAFNTILKSKDPAEYTRVLASLPDSSPMSVLDEIDQPYSKPKHRIPNNRNLFTLIGELQRTRKPWRMGIHTNAVALIGELTLDLSLAELPDNGILNIVTLIGETTIYIPRSLSVEIRSVNLIGEINILGESRSGILNFCHEEYDGAYPHKKHLIIHVVSIVGEVNIVQSENASQENASTVARRS